MSARADELIDAELDKKAIEDLDFELVCQLRLELLVIIGGIPVSVSKTAPCHEPAVATMRCRICGLDNLVCASHRGIVASDPNCFCMGCKTKAHGAVLYEFKTLPGGAS